MGNKQQSQTATKGVAFNLNPFPESWSREGYDFMGWASSPNATEVEYEDTAEVTFWDSIVRLYAVWQANETPSGETYVVTFNGNGGSVVGNSSRNVASGSRIGSLPTATRTGYTFAGWYTTSTTSGGTQVTSNTTISSVVTFFARWNIIEYDISYDLNGYNGTMPASAVTKYTVESGNITPSAPIPYSDNQAFQNWEPSSIAAGSTGNVTFTAIWTEMGSEDPVEDGVTFNANGGVFSDQTTIKLMSVPEGARVRNIKPENPTLSGYVFNGWWTTPNKAVGSHNVSQGRQVYDWELCNTDKTYYAAWTKPCQITFNANGGMFNGSATSRVITVDSNVEFDKAFQLMEDPLRTGYAFGWWYDDETCEHIRYNPRGIIDKDNEVYAGWTELDDTMCTVTLDAGDGVFEGSEKQKTLIVNKGSLFRTIKPEDPTRSGYNFNKWWTAPSIYAGNPISSPWSKIESDITLYANYTVATQITFNANGGTFGGTETTKVISADLYTEYYNILPDDPVRNGYIFDGWYWPSTSSSSTLIDPEGKASGDRTWVARWTQL